MQRAFRVIGQHMAIWIYAAGNTKTTYLPHLRGRIIKNGKKKRINDIVQCAYMHNMDEQLLLSRWRRSRRYRAGPRGGATYDFRLRNHDHVAYAE
jgi:hypothetical protein